jgi:type II secretory pathway pseudopilin PulG
MKQTRNMNQAGFTVIELLVAILVLIVIAAVAVSNIRGMRADNRDDTRKREINAIYYQLEALHERNGYYPEKLSASTLKGIDPENLKDEQDLAVNATGSQYTYKPKGCSKQKCRSFELSTELEREATYTKLSLAQ